MNSETGIDWQEVPKDHLAEWYKVFEDSNEPLNLSSPCPICRVASLHRWYVVGRPIDTWINKTHYVARGALWEWCSACGSFLHYSASVPDWWSSDLEVDVGKIRITPEPIEQARRAHERIENT